MKYLQIRQKWDMPRFKFAQLNDTMIPLIGMSRLNPKISYNLDKYFQEQLEMDVQYTVNTLAMPEIGRNRAIILACLRRCYEVQTKKRY